MEPRFRWLRSSYMDGYYETEGPNVNYAPLVRSKYHNLSELLLLPYSVTIKKLLKSAKSGTKIKIGYCSSGSDYYVQRLTDDEILMLEELQNRKDIIDSLKYKIEQAMPQESSQIKSETNKIAKLKKKYEKIIGAIK